MCAMTAQVEWLDSWDPHGESVCAMNALAERLDKYMNSDSMGPFIESLCVL